MIGLGKGTYVWDEGAPSGAPLLFHNLVNVVSWKAYGNESGDKLREYVLQRRVQARDFAIFENLSPDVLPDAFSLIFRQNFPARLLRVKSGNAHLWPLQD